MPHIRARFKDSAQSNLNEIATISKSLRKGIAVRIHENTLIISFAEATFAMSVLWLVYRTLKERFWEHEMEITINEDNPHAR